MISSGVMGFCLGVHTSDAGGKALDGRILAERIKHVTASLLANRPARIVNCQDTMWRVALNGFLTWAPVEEDGSSLSLNVTEKETIITVARITAAHEKLLLFLIAKRKTERVERSQSVAPDGCVLTHSPSGWTRVSTFREYFESLRQCYGDQDPIYRSLDGHSVHRSVGIRRFAAELGIVFQFIPPGRTDSSPRPLHFQGAQVHVSVSSKTRSSFQ
jgi:hypothetical protein